MNLADAPARIDDDIALRLPVAQVGVPGGDLLVKEKILLLESGLRA